MHPSLSSCLLTTLMPLDLKAGVLSVAFDTSSLLQWSRHKLCMYSPSCSAYLAIYY